jgi:hypothetical protein
MAWRYHVRSDMRVSGTPHSNKDEMTAICVPISESKSYSFMDVARGLFELDYPKKKLYVVFALDDFGANTVETKIEKFIERWPYPDNCFVVTTTLKGNDPKCSDIIPWKTRARFAATLRNLYTSFVVDNLPKAQYIFSVGSDIVLEPKSLKILRGMDKKVASGLYVSRIQHRPLALSYANGEWSYDDVDLVSTEPFMADWSGLDCALIQREVFTQVNWNDFSVDKYGIGEDGYFFLEAKEKGYQLWVNPRVKPLHIQDDGQAVAARPVPSLGLIISCPKCGWTNKLGKTWKDIEVGCGNCRHIFYADPFWRERVLDETAKGAGVSASII